MLYTGYIYLADDVIYIWVHCSCYCKINHDPRSFTIDFFSYRLFSRFFRLAAPEATHLELSGKTGMFHPKLLINFSLLINCRSNWLARLQDSQDRLVLCWSQTDLRIIPACCVSSARSHVFAPTRWENSKGAQEFLSKTIEFSNSPKSIGRNK